MIQPEGARANGLKAFDTVKKVLTDVGWEPEPTGIEGELIVDFSPDPIPISNALAVVRLESERFIYYLNFRDSVPKSRREEVMKFITRANYGLVVGNFELDLDGGSVRFKASIDFTGARLSAVLVRDTIQSSMDAVEVYADALVAVIRDGKSAARAIRAAEG